MGREERFSRAQSVVRGGLAVNLVLMVMKLWAGNVAGSKAVFADGIESACDFIAIVSTMTALAIGRRPYDHKHPYGHGRAESISALLVSLVILATAVGIFATSLSSLVKREFNTPGWIAIAAAAATIVVKEVLYRVTKRRADELQSPALDALARDHRKDATSSLATLAGVAGAAAGLPFLDPLAALLTSFFIAHIGISTFRSSTYDLMDGAPEGSFVEEVTHLAEGVEGVDHVHEIRARTSGQFVIVDLKLEMDPQMTVKESHAIADRVKRLIFEQHANVGDVMIHVNPHEEEHEDLIRL